MITRTVYGRYDSVLTRLRLCGAYSCKDGMIPIIRLSVCAGAPEEYGFGVRVYVQFISGFVRRAAARMCPAYVKAVLYFHLTGHLLKIP